MMLLLVLAHRALGILISIRFGDTFQLKNIGTSSFLGVSSFQDSTDRIQIFATNSLSHGSFYWQMKPYMVKSKSTVHCNSLIILENSQYSSFVSVELFFDRPFVRCSKDIFDAQIWNLTCLSQEREEVTRDTIVQFKNLNNKCFLTASFNRSDDPVIQNKWIVYCNRENTKQSLWKIHNGLFYMKKMYHNH